jgi:hypothetical protein
MTTKDKDCNTCKWAAWSDEPDFDELGVCQMPLPKSVNQISGYGLNKKTPFTDCPCWEERKDDE